jgi:L-alanine-DL-glutamate epimerase-like enolase superfamily enzyme
MARIAALRVDSLAVPGLPASKVDGAQATCLVRLIDEDGRIGIGECAGPPAVVSALIQAPASHAFWGQGLAGLLVGQDPLEMAALWQKLYQATLVYGRRGLAINALSGIDIALHDLAAQQAGVPVYKLMGGARRERLLPYATIFPGWPRDTTIGRLMRRLAELFEQALALGFRALKMEVIFGELASDADLVALIHEGRAMVGPEVTFLVDFGYRWQDWQDARWVLDRVADCDLYLAEATLQHDDLRGHAELAKRCAMRIAGAEYATTRWEALEWVERGRVAVLQTDIIMGGGLTELRRIADLAEMNGVELIPHGWKTGINAAAARHLHVACGAVPMIEHVPPQLYDLPLRDGLVAPEPELDDGYLALPAAPGLGVTLVEGALDRFRIR